MSEKSLLYRIIWGDNSSEEIIPLNPWIKKRSDFSCKPTVREWGLETITWRLTYERCQCSGKGPSLSHKKLDVLSLRAEKDQKPSGQELNTSQARAGNRHPPPLIATWPCGDWLIPGPGSSYSWEYFSFLNRQSLFLFLIMSLGMVLCLETLSLGWPCNSNLEPGNRHVFPSYFFFRYWPKFKCAFSEAWVSSCFSDDSFSALHWCQTMYMTDLKYKIFLSSSPSSSSWQLPGFTACLSFVFSLKL